jgi:hypothetical protein
MPTSKVEATENYEMSGKAGTSTVRTPKEPEFRKNTGTKNGQRVDYVRKTPKHRKEPELPKHRKFDSKQRIPGNLDIRKKESRKSMRDRRPVQLSAKMVQDAKPGAGRSCGRCSQGEEPRGTRAEEPRGTRAEEPKIPMSLKLSLRGSVETQAQHRQVWLGELWSGSVSTDLTASDEPDQCGLIGRLSGAVNEEYSSLTAP